jgi:hypothetical protein
MALFRDAVAEEAGKMRIAALGLALAPAAPPASGQILIDTEQRAAHCAGVLRYRMEGTPARRCGDWQGLGFPTFLELAAVLSTTVAAGCIRQRGKPA